MGKKARHDLAALGREHVERAAGRRACPMTSTARPFSAKGRRSSGAGTSGRAPVPSRTTSGLHAMIRRRCSSSRSEGDDRRPGRDGAVRADDDAAANHPLADREVAGTVGADSGSPPRPSAGFIVLLRGRPPFGPVLIRRWSLRASSRACASSYSAVRVRAKAPQAGFLTRRLGIPQISSRRHAAGPRCARAPSLAARPRASWIRARSSRTTSSSPWSESGLARPGLLGRVRARRIPAHHSPGRSVARRGCRHRHGGSRWRWTTRRSWCG